MTTDTTIADHLAPPFEHRAAERLYEYVHDRADAAPTAADWLAGLAAVDGGVALELAQPADYGPAYVVYHDGRYFFVGHVPDDLAGHIPPADAVWWLARIGVGGVAPRERAGFDPDDHPILEYEQRHAEWVEDLFSS